MSDISVFEANSDSETFEVGKALSDRLNAGDIVLFSGDLGAGKTTMIRGLIAGLGVPGSVRSPTFNLIQLYLGRIPVMHADLYRLQAADDIGLEDYFDDHLCLIEWPDRLHQMVEVDECWQVAIDFTESGRRIEILEPTIASC